MERSKHHMFDLPKSSSIPCLLALSNMICEQIPSRKTKPDHKVIRFDALSFQMLSRPDPFLGCKHEADAALSPDELFVRVPLAEHGGIVGILGGEWAAPNSPDKACQCKNTQGADELFSWGQQWTSGEGGEVKHFTE